MADLLRCTNLTIEVAGRRLVKALDFAAPAGSITCLLGKNGVGKSLTLHTLAGLRPPQGSLQLNGRELAEWPRKDIARMLGFVAQDVHEIFPCSVMETVIVGRHPHIGFWNWESERDHELARSALATVDLQGFEQRQVDTLSGGERRRLAIATALTQAPQVFILDEPTNHLDPQHQLDILQLLRAKAEQGCAVVMSLHDVGLAARFADYSLLLYGDAAGGKWQHGASDAVLNTEALTQLYGTSMREISWAGGRTFICE